MAGLLSRVRGHDETVERFSGLLAAGRMPATWIFVGPSGVGKKTFALALAQSLVCEKKPIACGACPACVRVEKGQSESLRVFEPAGAQYKIEQAREIIEFVSLQKLGRSRVVILDGTERLNAASSNALLKTLEEPPEGTYFFLVSSSLYALLSTIRSRSQVVRFSPLSPALVKQIAGIEDWAAEASGGSVERALLLQGSEEFKELETRGLELLRLNFSKPGSSVFGELKDLVKDKETALFLAQTYQRWVRDLYHLRFGAADVAYPLASSWSSAVAARDDGFLERLWEAARKLESDVFGNIDRQLSFEHFLLGCR